MQSQLNETRLLLETSKQTEAIAKDAITAFSSAHETLITDNNNLRAANADLVEKIQQYEISKKQATLDEIKEQLLIFLFHKPTDRIVPTQEIASFTRIPEQTLLFHLNKLAELDMVHAHYPSMAQTPQIVPYGWYIKDEGRRYLIENKRV